MMYEAIKNFPSQFSFEPEIVGANGLKTFDKFVLAGMGGSNHAARLLASYDPSIDIVIHRNYGLPALTAKEFAERLIIISSYSGNTEEPFDALEEATQKGYAVAAMSVGGKLLERAKELSVPYIQMPDTGIQPRSALGFSMKSLLALMGNAKALKEAGRLASELNSPGLEAEGKSLAETVRGHVPVIYASARNESIAGIWKIKANETGKIPAFYNEIPELNHNEMTGFDAVESTRALSQPFHFLVFKDPDDHPRIQKRMDILEKLYRDRSLSVTMLSLSGSSMFNKIFSSLLLGDWFAYYSAELYGVESEQVPMVEEFKRLMAA